VAGTIITLSPRVPLDDAERMVRTRLARDGQVALAASDGRQVRQLRRLAARLRGEASTQVHLWREQAGGVTYLTVAAGHGRTAAAWWGAPKVGGGPRA
jgi:hypothetical protein